MRRSSRSSSSRAAGLALVAILFCGCASTHRFVVDPGAFTAVKIDEAYTERGTLVRFDAQGGLYDPATRAVRGRTPGGDPVDLSLARVYRLRLRGFDGERESRYWSSPAALAQGVHWRPGGRVRRLVLTSGAVIDLQKTPVVIDPAARVIRTLPAGRPPVVVPFAEILFVQVREAHPTGTALCVLGVAFAGLAVGIALSGPWGVFP